MAELEYFAANDAGRDDRRTGRLTAAGIMLLLAALPPGYWALMMAIDVTRFSYRSRADIDEAIWGLIFAITAVYLFAAGLGLIMKYRWARPLTLIATTSWLTFGSATWLIAALMTLRESIPNFEIIEVPLFAIMLTLLFAVTIGAPLLIRKLVRPMAVRHTLELFDPTPRWAERLSVRRMSTAIDFLLMAVMVWTFSMSMENSNWWARDLTPWKTAIGVAVLFVVAAVGSASGKRVSRAGAMAAAMVAFSVLVYVGFSGGNRRPFRYVDSASSIGFLLAVDTVCVLQMRRDGWAESPEQERGPAAD